MNMSDKYLKNVQFSEEDQWYIGSVPNQIGECSYSDGEQGAFLQIPQIVYEWIKINEEYVMPLPVDTEGRNYSGKFLFRLGPDQHI